MRVCFMLARCALPLHQSEREIYIITHDCLTEESLESRCALCLQGCAHPMHLSEREREGGRERSVEYVQNILFLFLKGMTGALAPLII